MTLYQFQKYQQSQETMIRAAMPRIAALDPSPLPAFATDEVPGRVRVVWSLGRRYQQKGAFTLAEVAHA